MRRWFKAQSIIPLGPDGPISQAIRAIFGLFCSIATSLLVSLCIPLDWNIPTCCANHNQTIIHTNSYPLGANGPSNITILAVLGNFLLNLGFIYCCTGHLCALLWTSDVSTKGTAHHRPISSISYFTILIFYPCPLR